MSARRLTAAVAAGTSGVTLAAAVLRTQRRDDSDELLAATTFELGASDSAQHAAESLNRNGFACIGGVLRPAEQPLGELGKQLPDELRRWMLDAARNLDAGAGVGVAATVVIIDSGLEFSTSTVPIILCSCPCVPFETHVERAHWQHPCCRQCIRQTRGFARRWVRI